jgi:uncharacterized protein
MKGHVTVRNTSRDADIARADWRGSLFGRARGLLGRKNLPAGDGIVIWPCSSVHMFFMRFALDVIYIDREYRVVKTVSRLKPFRVSFGGRGAHAAIELPEGTVERSGTQPGDHLAMLTDPPATPA